MTPPALHVCQAGVASHPRPGLAAHSRGGPLERAPAAREDTGPSTGCAVVAEGVQRATTPAAALGKLQRKAQAGARPCWMVSFARVMRGACNFGR